jgi:DNA modification methylase
MYSAHLLSIFRIIKKVLKPTGSFYLNLGDARASTLMRQSGDDGEIPSRIEQGMLNDGWLLVDKSTWRRANLSSGEESKSKYSYELLFHFVKNRKIRLWHNIENREWVEKKPSQRYRNLKTDVGIKWNKLRTTMPAIMKTPIENMTQQKLEERRLWRQIWQPFAYYYDLDAISGLQGNRIPEGLNIQTEEEPIARIINPLFEAFPEEFCIRPILSSCPPEGIVADPFAGSGTTLCVAKKLGRHFLGCDINPASVEMAGRRLAMVTSPLEVF